MALGIARLLAALAFLSCGMFFSACGLFVSSETHCSEDGDCPPNHICSVAEGICHSGALDIEPGEGGTIGGGDEDAGSSPPDGGVVIPDAGLPDAGLPDAGPWDAGEAADASLASDGGGLFPEAGGQDPDAGFSPGDGGLPAMESGPPATDAGVDVEDAAAPPLDAGPALLEGGPPLEDGGPPTPEAGLPPLDSGPPPMDAGPPAMDAGPPDTTPPPALDSFSGAPSMMEYGAIVLDFDFPDDVSDVDVVYVYRAQGPTAPPDCMSGTLAMGILQGFIDQSFTDQSLAEREVYSYRVCIWDEAGNLTSTDVAENILTRGCTTNPIQEDHPDVKAAIQDAYWYSFGTNNGWAPREIFSGVTLQEGQNITLTQALGNSICRIYNNAVQCGPIACPGQWKLFFEDGNGNVLWQLAPDDLTDYSSGVPVPAGAIKATIGFRDDELGGSCTPNHNKCCMTGESCGVEDLYFDNEGNRSTTSGDSTDGCAFTFEYEELICD
jgi:hypothetical protein